MVHPFVSGLGQGRAVSDNPGPSFSFLPGFGYKRRRRGDIWRMSGRRMGAAAAIYGALELLAPQPAATGPILLPLTNGYTHSPRHFSIKIPLHFKYQIPIARHWPQFLIHYHLQLIHRRP